MATFGTLAVNLIARTQGLESGLARSTKSINMLSHRVGGLTQSFSYLSRMLIGGGVLYGLKKVVMEAANFEKQMAFVSTMLDDTSMKYMPQYSKQLKQLSIVFGESTENLSKGLYDILSAQIPASKAMKVLESSTKMAKAGFTDTAIATKALIKLLNSYNLSVEKAYYVSDILFTIVFKGVLTFEELATNIGKVAALVATAGISIEEFGATIATMTKAGLDAELALTYLGSIITGFLKPSVQGLKLAYDEFGLVLGGSTLRTLGLTKSLEKLKKATSDQLAVMFPNKRALIGVANIIPNLTQQYSNLDAMLDSTGATQVALTKATDTTSHKLSQMGQAIKSVTRDMGDFILELDVIEGIVNRFISWAPTENKWKNFILDFRAAFNALNTTVGEGETTLEAYMRGFVDLRSEMEKPIKKVEEVDRLDSIVKAATKQVRADVRAREAMEDIAFAGMAFTEAELPIEMLKEWQKLAKAGPPEVLLIPIIPMSAEMEKAKKGVESLILGTQKEVEIMDRLNMSWERSREWVAAIVEVEQAFGKGTAATERYVAQIDEAYEKLAEGQKWQQVADTIADSLAGAFEGIVFEAQKAGDAIMSIFQAVSRMMMREFVFDPLSQMIKGAMSGWFAGGADKLAPSVGPITSAWAHAGGIVGQITANRMVPASAFMGAEIGDRGLSPLRPTLLRPDEGVFTPGQMARLAPVGATTPNVKIEIINQSSVPLGAEVGEIEYDGQEYVLQIMAHDMVRGGPYGDMVRRAKR